jgi:hypothetical protein
MSNLAPNLLDDDGSASMATAFLMSHHALRRDLALFRITLQRLEPGDQARVAALQSQWKSYHEHLHGHHEAEDQRLFPSLRSAQPDLGATIDHLVREHAHIDPLLAQGDAAFAQLPHAGPAAAVVSELSALLDAHLGTEEAQVVPFIRGAKSFPPPASEAEARLYAEGFAWSCHGIAPEVLEQVHAMLPESIRSRLPAARAAFEARCQRAWGSVKPGASRTAIPTWVAAG